LHQGEETLFSRVAGRLAPEVTARLEALIAAGDDGAEEGQAGEDGAPVLALIKADPGNVSLNSMLAEIGKLRAVRTVGLPAGLIADIAPRVVAAWRPQAMVESPSHLRAHPNPAKTLTLLAALLHARQQEITDTLVDLLISTVHRINARATSVKSQGLGSFASRAHAALTRWHVLDLFPCLDNENGFHYPSGVVRVAGNGDRFHFHGGPVPVRQ
jgi:hypothetical protein